MREIYQKFLSSGFAEANSKSFRHMVALYRHNYSRFLPESRGARILDIGCGLGQFLDFLGRSGYTNILGVDISAEAIDFCREKGIEKVKLVDDLKEFLAVSGMYDLIVLNDVIEHFSQAEVLPILQKIYEKLNADGTLIVKTGNLASLVGPRIRYGDFTHQLGFTEYSLTQLLKVAKFRDIIIRSFVFPKNRPTRIIRWLIQRVLHGLWKLAYFLEFTSVPKYVDELIFAVVKK